MPISAFGPTTLHCPGGMFSQPARYSRRDAECCGLCAFVGCFSQQEPTFKQTPVRSLSQRNSIPRASRA